METTGDATGLNTGRLHEVNLQDRIGLSEKPEVPAEVQKANELLQRLIQHATNLVIEIATCDCNKIHECGIAKQGREIAKVLKEFQKIKPGGVPSGQGGGKV